MPSIRPLAISLTALLLIAPSIAARTRTVKLPRAAVVSAEEYVAEPDLMAGAEGHPLSVASDATSTAMAWTTPENDVVYADVVTGNQPAFGVLVPGVINREVKIVRSNAGYVIAWHTLDSIRVGLLTPEGITETAHIPLEIDIAELRLASAGERVMVGWIRKEPPARNRQFMGQLITSNGQLYGSPFELGPYACIYRGLLAGGNGSFLVVLMLDNCSGTPLGPMYVRAVSAEGVLGEAQNFATGAVSSEAEISWSGEQYFLPWFQLNGDQMISRFSPAGTLIQSALMIEYPLHIAATPDSTTMLYASEGGISAVALNETLQPVGERPLVIPTTLNRVETFTSAGDEVQIVWSKMDCEMCLERIISSRWSIGAVSPVEEAPLGARVRRRYHPTLAASGDTWTATWQEESDDASGMRVMYAARQGAGPWSAPQRISDSSLRQTEPVIASAGATTLIVWEEAPGAQPRLMGRLLTATPSATFEISPGFGADVVATDDGGFLVTWIEPRSNLAVLRAQKIGASGVRGPAWDIESFTAWSMRTQTSLSRHTGGFIVVLEALVECRRFGCTRVALMQSLSPDGAPVGEPIPISPTNSTIHSPAVASNGTTAQALYWDGGDDQWPTQLYSRQLAPGFAPPVTVDTTHRPLYRGWNFRHESAAIGVHGAGFLAAWAAYENGDIRIAELPGWIVPRPLTIGSLSTGYIDIASKPGQSGIIYSRRPTDRGLGSGSQIFFRIVHQ